jgi:hypothetical protein
MGGSDLLAMVTRRQGHYRLYAYVCGAGCVQHADVDGTVTFMQVFMKRPATCRYAIVGKWDPERNGEIFVVWDLDATLLDAAARIHPPEAVKVYDDIDQAIMATLMLYEND